MAPTRSSHHTLRINHAVKKASPRGVEGETRPPTKVKGELRAKGETRPDGSPVGDRRIGCLYGPRTVLVGSKETRCGTRHAKPRVVVRTWKHAGDVAVRRRCRNGPWIREKIEPSTEFQARAHATGDGVACPNGIMPSIIRRMGWRASGKQLPS